jgi:hypothetical protein
MNERDCRGSGLIRIPRAGPSFEGSKPAKKLRSGVAGACEERHQNMTNQEGLPSLNFLLPPVGATKPITLFHSRNLPLPPENGCHAPSSSDRGLEREHRISLTDWLRMFGFDLRQIPRLQCSVPGRTVPGI